MLKVETQNWLRISEANSSIAHSCYQFVIKRQKLQLELSRSSNSVSTLNSITQLANVRQWNWQHGQWIPNLSINFELRWCKSVSLINFIVRSFPHFHVCLIISSFFRWWQARPRSSLFWNLLPGESCLTKLQDKNFNSLNHWHFESSSLKCSIIIIISYLIIATVGVLSIEI